MIQNDSSADGLPLTPMAYYEQALQQNGFQKDVAQAQAMTMLQALYESIVSGRHKQQYKSTPTLPVKRRGLFSKKPRNKKESIKPVLVEPAVKGLYFWGGVGRGKTFLMDAFYECLPGDRKLRVHFHRFMRRVHGDLRALQGQADPLKIIGRRFADEIDVVCFDEFFVTDITDAMILGGVLEAMFHEGILLVATSNILPENLYKDGLQRERFLPAIALLQHHQQVFNLDSGIDYRLRALERAEIYHYPLDGAATSSLAASFVALAPEVGQEGGSIDIEGRPVATVRCADGVLWCEFEAVCDGPRSQNDYIELARIYNTVLISGVPQFLGVNDDQARRFINMVDEFYDRNVKLILSAASDITQLYVKGQLEFEFRRTESRLLEMQSHEYLESPHLP
ncbi:MAG: AFG1 family ATPase [Gammaproteobacteria bacterium]|nr:AFG1 family ATPase [Gammaproteobacteria bacterium]